jgi:DinB superfamily
VPENAVSLLAKNYAIAHGRVLESAERTDDGQFRKSMGTRIHSVAWQVWHIARWDDRFAEIIVEKTPDLAGRLGPPVQIWAAESLAKQWGLPVGHMGRRDTGTEMDDEPADALRLPAKALVVDYARPVFARLQTVLEAIPGASLFAVMADDPDGDS